MTGKVLNPTELGDMLSEILAGAAGGSDDDWRAAIGEVEKLPT